MNDNDERRYEQLAIGCLWAAGVVTAILVIAFIGLVSSLAYWIFQNA